MSYPLDISRYHISQERLIALAEEFGGKLLLLAVGDEAQIEFLPQTIERFDGKKETLTSYDLSQRFLAALQSYKK